MFKRKKVPQAAISSSDTFVDLMREITTLQSSGPDATTSFGSLEVLDVVLQLPDVVLQLPDVVLQLPDVVLQLPDVVLQLPDVVLQLPDVVLQLPDVVLQLPDVVLQLPDVVLQLPDVVLQLPVARSEVLDVDEAMEAANITKRCEIATTLSWVKHACRFLSSFFGLPCQCVSFSFFFGCGDVCCERKTIFSTIASGDEGNVATEVS
jgi:hypothetical protein